MSKFEIRYIPFENAEFRMNTSDDGKSVTLDGHAAVFNSFSNDLGGFKEIIRPGAFQRTLKNEADVRLLVNHDDLPLARTKSKTLQLTEDSRGLAFAANLDKSDPDVQRLLPKIARGDLSSMSFAFRCAKDDQSWRTENGQDIRELHAVDLHGGDVSVVTNPAYDAASVAIRSMGVIGGLEEVQRDHMEYRSRVEAEAQKIANTHRGMSIAHALRLMTYYDEM